MRILLDTHIFLWFISADEQLPATYRAAVQDPDNEILLSVISLWEIIVKHQLGKLPLREPPEEFIPEQRIRHMIDSLPITESAVARLAELPDVHRDPFDRLLVCQALDSRLVLMTRDKVLKRYPAPLFDPAAVAEDE